MVVGALIAAVSLLMLGFTREIIGWFVHDDEAARMPTIVLAVLSIYVVDFAINAGMFAMERPTPTIVPAPC